MTAASVFFFGLACLTFGLVVGVRADVSGCTLNDEWWKGFASALAAVGLFAITVGGCLLAFA